MNFNENRSQRFTPFIRRFGVLFFTALLVLAGCDNGQPDACADTPVTLFVEGPPPSDLRPITFDSFGVALDADLSGTLQRLSDGSGRCPDETVLHAGSGQGTHLGQVSLEQSHCVDPENPSAITDGQFSYEGAGGASIIGIYEGTVTPAANGDPEIEANVQITGGHFACSPPDPEEGRGTFSGTLGENFDFRLDGWLFHHREEKEL